MLGRVGCHGLSRCEFQDNFAGLAKAITESGADASHLLILEENGVTTLSVAECAWRRGELAPELLATLQAALVTAGRRLKTRMETCPAELGPSAKRVKRCDIPVMKPSRGGSLRAALASAAPVARQQTLEVFRRDIWARSNAGSSDARLRTWVAICRAWDMQPFPLTQDVVFKVSASFKAGGYRSARQYFCRARREHVMMTSVAVPPDVEMAIRDGVRSIERGMGKSEMKDAFVFERVKFPNPSSPVSWNERFAVTMMILGCWFLLREVELASLRAKHMTVDIETKTVRLTLQSSKNDQIGSLVTRSHGCYCKVVGESHCPFHVAAAYSQQFKLDNEAPLFPDKDNQEMSKGDTIKLFRQTLQSRGIKTTRPGALGQADVECFHGHCLRVSGAQFLARLKFLCRQ